MKLTINTPDGIEEYDFVSSGDVSAQELAGVTDAEEIYEGIQLLEDVTSEATRQTRDFELGSISGVPEFKTVMERQCTGRKWWKVCVNVPVLYKRTSIKKLYASVSITVPDANDVWAAVRDCALTSLGLSLAVAIEAPALAVPAAKAAMIVCLKVKGLTAVANSLDLGLYTTSTSTEWRRAS